LAPAERRRWAALYFQLRRAYFFIDEALVGHSTPMRALRQALWNSVFTADLATYALLLWERLQDFPTLLLGETGTGNGSAAAATRPTRYQRPKPRMPGSTRSPPVGSMPRPCSVGTANGSTTTSAPTRPWRGSRG
jgi:hypothetical protein